MKRRTVRTVYILNIVNVHFLRLGRFLVIFLQRFWFDSIPSGVKVQLNPAISNPQRKRKKFDIMGAQDIADSK